MHIRRVWIRVISIILIVTAVFQISLRNKFINKQEEVKIGIQHKEKRSIKYKDLSTLNNELKCLQKCKIIGAENDKEKWKVKVKLTGDRKEILNEMINLQKYEITSYYMKKSLDENFVVLEICGF